MATQFEKLLADLSEFLQMEIKPDKKGAVALTFREHFVQIESDPEQEYVTLFSPIGEVPEGRYREDILEQALRSNGFPPPNRGILCLGKKNSMLYIFDKIPLASASREQLLSTLPPILEKVKLWKEALKFSQVPIIEKPKNVGKVGVQDLFNLLKQ